MRLLIGTSALLHFLVDGLCVCCLYLLLSAYGGPALVGSFILYNVLAFLTQPWTGMLADSRRLLPLLLPLAVTLLAVAVVLMVSLWTMAITATVAIMAECTGTKTAIIGTAAIIAAVTATVAGSICRKCCSTRNRVIVR